LCEAGFPPTQRASVQWNHETYHIELQTDMARLTRQRSQTSDGGTRGDQRLMQNGPSFQISRLSPPPGRRAMRPNSQARRAMRRTVLGWKASGGQSTTP
jgi:hypothetical protein